jgi:hypothetical protein
MLKLDIEVKQSQQRAGELTHTCEMPGNLWLKLITEECSSSDSCP